jgi:hypothetical protein
VPDKVPQDADPEDERRPDPAPPVHVELQPRADGDDPDATDCGVFALVPLPEGQVSDIVPLPRKPLRKVAVPALGAAHRVGVETVVDNANAHR